MVDSSATFPTTRFMVPSIPPGNISEMALWISELTSSLNRSPGGSELSGSRSLSDMVFTPRRLGTWAPY